MKKEQKFWSFQNLFSLSILILVIFAIRWSVAEPYHVPTGSMEPTIKVGDRLFTWKLEYQVKVPFTKAKIFEISKPVSGDIVVFPCPQEPSNDCVKRVIAVGGDTIKLEQNVVYINNVAQPLTSHENDRSVLDDIHDMKEIKNLYRENLKNVDHWVIQNKKFSYASFPNTFRGYGEDPFIVPEDSIFVMGDNRDNSVDSRFWGIVPLTEVKGRALRIIWSMYFPAKSDGSGESWIPQFRWYRFGSRLI